MRPTCGLVGTQPKAISPKSRTHSCSRQINSEESVRITDGAWLYPGWAKDFGMKHNQCSDDRGINAFKACAAVLKNNAVHDR